MQHQKSIFTNKPVLKSWIVLYTDLLIINLIAFLCIGVVFAIIFIKYLKFPVWIVMIVSIFTAVLCSPLLSKIKLAERIIDSYENMLINNLYENEKENKKKKKED